MSQATTSTFTSISLTFDGQPVPNVWPSVSLCMIVKNEEKNLAACLESVGNFPGEIIIVDTGSTDNTVEIARKFGARVKYFTWINDFAAARNESIREANGEWIFWLDADDRLSPYSLNQLKQATACGQADVYRCRVVSPATSWETEQTTALHFRLFRNRAGLKFQYALHEDLALSQANCRLTVADTNISLEHQGYAVSKGVLQAKAQRNLAIIDQCLAREPNNLRWQHHRGISLALLGDYAGAIEAHEAVIAQPPANLSWEVDVYQAYLSLVSAYLKLNRPEQARLALEHALKLYPARRHLAIVAGMFYLGQDNPTEALVYLERALTIPPQSDTVGHAWPAGLLEAYLTQAHMLQGQPIQAAQAAQAMLKCVGERAQQILPQTQREAQILLEAAQFAVVVELLKPFAPGTPEILRMLAQAERGLGHWDRAGYFLCLAMALTQPQPGEWVNLAAIQLLKTGLTDSARRLCQLALSTTPMDISANHFLDLINAHHLGPRVALSGWIQTLLATPQHKVVWHQLVQAAAVLGLAPAQLLRWHGQRLINQRQYWPATETFLLMVSLFPNDPEAYKSLAVTLKGIGKEDDAILAWQTAQQLERQATTAWRPYASPQNKETASSKT